LNPNKEDCIVKILVIDDSLMDRKITINALKKNGVQNEVLQAADGEEGLKVLSENYKDICLILLDWQMPKMDGLAFMKGVINVPAVSSIPIIMITASGSDDSKQTAYSVNPHLAGYVVKPYKIEGLLEVIKPHIK
jgi:two-component system chemotaxis response regulator CheY